MLPGLALSNDWIARDEGMHFSFSALMFKTLRDKFNNNSLTDADISDLSLIQNSKCIVGNSSSGIREASYLGIPSVNIGSRQIYRETAKNVINTEHNYDKIYKAIKIQINKGKYKKSNLYGSGKAAKKIFRILKNIKTINVKKKINYIKY